MSTVSHARFTLSKFGSDVVIHTCWTLDVLALLRKRLESAESFEVISGYRSPATNARLREAHENSGVASRSLHMQGMAIDIRLNGRSLSALRDTALSLRAGGVGYYPASDFVHVDVGRIRRW